MQRLLFLLFFFLSQTVHAQQQFQITFYEQPFSAGSKLNYSPDGGYLLSGRSMGSGTGYLDLRKLRHDFSSSWNKSFYISDSVIIPEGFAETINYQITGIATHLLNHNQPREASELLIYKVDSSGNYLWNKKFALGYSLRPSSILNMPDGTFYICSRHYPTSATDFSDIIISRHDVNGNALWAKKIAGSTDELPVEMIRTSDDKLAIAGTASGFAMGSHFFLSKLDTSGNYLWFTNYILSTTDTCRTFLQTNDGGFLMVGSGGTRGQDVLLIKADINGTIQISKSFTLGFGSNYMFSDGLRVLNTADGGYILSGTTRLASGNTDPFIFTIKISQNLVVEWYNSYGFTHENDLQGILQTSDRGYLLGGSRRISGSGQMSSLIIKTDSLGESGCLETGIDLLEQYENPLSFSPGPLQSTIQLNYSFSNLQILSPTLVTDTSCAIITSLNTVLKSDLFIHAYPQPFRDQFMIELDKQLLNGTYTIQLYSQIGDKIKAEIRQIDENKFSFHVPDAVSGLYYLHLSGNSDIVWRKKIICIR